MDAKTTIFMVHELGGGWPLNSFFKMDGEYPVKMFQLGRTEGCCGLLDMAHVDTSDSDAIKECLKWWGENSHGLPRGWMYIANNEPRAKWAENLGFEFKFQFEAAYGGPGRPLKMYYYTFPKATNYASCGNWEKFVMIKEGDLTDAKKAVIERYKNAAYKQANGLSYWAITRNDSNFDAILAT